MQHKLIYELADCFVNNCLYFCYFFVFGTDLMAFGITRLTFDFLRILANFSSSSFVAKL